jgi:glycosyltransferase involved in cell wall biosynthesis
MGGEKQDKMSSGRPLVSVIMSVYNTEDYLYEAVNSIANQLWQNWECIIIDDASTDSSPGILAGFLNDARFTVVRNAVNCGLTKNLNTAIDLCKGEYIARMDADDISMPSRLEKQVAYLEQHNEVSIVCSFIELIDENGLDKGVWPLDRRCATFAAIKKSLPYNNCIAHPTVMLRADVMRKYRYNEAQVHSQDWDLWLRLVANGAVMYKIPEALLQYRVHTKSVTSVSLKKSAFLKKKGTYKTYLQTADKTIKDKNFQNRIRMASFINSIKLVVSQVKRKIFSK